MIKKDFKLLERAPRSGQSELSTLQIGEHPLADK